MIYVNIGVIGVGDIAKKAYLPLYTAKRNFTFHFYTRNDETREVLKNQYGFQVYHSMSSLLSQKLDGVMIHAATSAHEELIETCLEHRIPVFVDKPITDNIQSTRSLINKAKEKGVPFVAGFNRRFAPAYQKAKDLSNPNIILLQKNRYQLPGEARTFIYDDFIHVVDTLLYMLEGPPEEWDVKGQWKEGKLASVKLNLSKDGMIASGIMNRDAGVNEEVLEVMSPAKKMVVNNLSELSIRERQEERKVRESDWTPMLVTRGFEEMVQTFFNCLEKEIPYPYTHEDILQTHEWCEKILQQLQEDKFL